MDNRLEILYEDIENIKEAIKILVSHIRPDGDMSIFSMEEMDRLNNLVSKWNKS